MPDRRTFPDLPGFRLVSLEAMRVEPGAPVRVIHPDPGLVATFVPTGPGTSRGDWYQLALDFPPEGVVDVLAQLDLADGVVWQRLPARARNQFAAQFRVTGAIAKLTLTITGSGRLTEPQRFAFARLGRSGHLAAVMRRGREVFRRDGARAIWSALNYVWRLSRPGAIVISAGSTAEAGESLYDAWMRVFDEVPERDRARHEQRLATLTQRPLISVLALTAGSDAPSLADQIYPDGELLVAPCGDNPAASLNGLLARARGDYVLPLSAGVRLRPHALLDLALTLARHPSAELIYADEDTIDAGGKRRDPRFKPAWSPHVLASHDYIGALALMRTDTVRRLGGWQTGTAPQYDLLRRLTDAAQPDTIVHLAKLLVHAPRDDAPPQPVRYVVPSPAPRVSLIIPTRDSASLLGACIRSIRERTRYPDYEVLVIDNGSVEEETKRLFADLAKDPAIRVLARPGPFNFSGLNNSAVAETTGTIIGLVNNDIEVTDEDWLDAMVSLAARPEVGCVGARLLYPDGRLQHGGIVIGLGGVAGHAHRFAGPDEPGYLQRLTCVQNMSAVTAACLLVRRSVFDEVGGLDEGLRVAFNDVDFCLKVRAAGYLNLWTPFATLVHHESVSRGRDLTPAKARRFADEYATMQKRWGAALLYDPYYSPNLTYDREDFSVRPR